ncbi:unnamed protein product [Calypogeia fissa]
MPLTSSAVDAFGVTTLVLVILLCFVGVFCVAYVLHFRSKIHKEQLLALRDFNSLWVVRIIMIIFATLWGLVELLRLPLMRRHGWVMHDMSFQWQANMCRTYVLLSMGLLEPCYFLSALFLVQGSLRNAPFTPRRSWNGRVIGLIMLCCLPVFLAQLFFVVITPSFEFNEGYKADSEGYDGTLPYYFTRAFEELQEPKDRVAVCTYPLFSTLALGLFGFFYNIYFLYLGWRLFSMVINRRLQLRVYGLVMAVVLLLPVHVMFLGLSVLSNPSEPVFEAMGFLGFLTVLFCTTVGEGILVVRPIADALAVRWVFESDERRKRGTQDEMPADPILVSLSSLSVFGTERDEAAIGARQSLLGKITVTSNDHRSDADLMEVALIPMGNSGVSSGTNGILVSPPESPALPGKPFSFHNLHALV